MIRVALMWHMHQPVYRHPRTGEFELPWVRLHGLKDYRGMAEVLGEFPGVHTTVNLVPSLLQQIEAYLSGGRDRFQVVAEKPADALEATDRAFMTRHFFSAHPAHMIHPHPRYRELLALREEMSTGSGVPLAAWRDLQVWATLAWFDRERAEADERVRGLLEKGREFTEADKQVLAAAQLDQLAGIIPAWRHLQEEGIVEIATSPLTHPILPLLLDPQSGREANPALPPYNLDFHWIEDARRQLASALDFIEERFGRRPGGIWPSEGGLSEAVVELLAELGVTWTASDEINLARSLSPDGRADWSGRRDERLYRPWSFGHGGVRILFRDHDLSDRIGFHYQRMAPGAAAADFMARLHSIAAGVKDPLVAVILDGENPWEHYADNGRPFLRALLGSLAEDPAVEAVTCGRAAEHRAESLPRLAPGSWIGGNFDIWIGDESDRRAWAQLARARECWEGSRGSLEPEALAEARRCLDVAQGSDWFWWFGPEHQTADLDVFDRLFRLNLQRVYELCGCNSPEDLFIPVCGESPPGLDVLHPPRGELFPRLDGRETHFFEWRDAGRLNIHAGRGAMDGGGTLVTAVYFGFGGGRFFLRVDTRDRADRHFRNGSSLRLGIRRAGESVRRLDLPPRPPWGEGRVGVVMECGLNLAALELEPGDLFEFYLEWLHQGVRRQLLPFDGFYPVIVPGPGNYAAHWIV